MPIRAPVHLPPGVTVATRARRRYDAERGSASARGYDRRWERFRAWVLATWPLCRDCEAAGRVTASNEVHHIAKLRERPDLRLDPDNVLALCKPCHDTRTGRGE